jgi:hypothetical protein
MHQVHNKYMPTRQHCSPATTTHAPCQAQQSKGANNNNNNNQQHAVEAAAHPATGLQTRLFSGETSSGLREVLLLLTTRTATRNQAA